MQSCMQVLKFHKCTTTCRFTFTVLILMLIMQVYGYVCSVDFCRVVRGSAVLKSTFYVLLVIDIKVVSHGD